MPAISKRLVREYPDREFREEYVVARVKRWLADQITLFGNRKDVTAATVGSLTVDDLLEQAAETDTALLVSFTDHVSFVVRTSDMSPERLVVRSYDENAQKVLNRITVGSATYRLTAVAETRSPAVHWSETPESARDQYTYSFVAKEARVHV